MIDVNRRFLLKLLLLLISFSLISCTKYSELVIEKDRTIVQPVAWGIDSFTKIDWKVGTTLRDTVSRGILFTIKLPLIEDEKLKNLILQKDVDGWLLRITKHDTNLAQTLGHIYIPFPNPNQRAGISDQIELASFQVNYHAASVSERFSNLNCPAFGHRKYLKSVELEDDYNNSSKLLNVSAIEEESVAEKVEPFSFNTRVFSAGNSLRGTYELQIAFYNFKNGNRKSNFLPAPQILKVDYEEERFIEGCGVGNDEIRTKEDDSSKKEFKFGR